MDDAIMNYTATPLMDGSKPWRGPREKDIGFMSSLIMAITDIGQVVVDVNAGVGMSYFTCHHILVFIFYFCFFFPLLTFPSQQGLTSMHGGSLGAISLLSSRTRTPSTVSLST